MLLLCKGGHARQKSGTPSHAETAVRVKGKCGASLSPNTSNVAACVTAVAAEHDTCKAVGHRG